MKVKKRNSFNNLKNFMIFITILVVLQVIIAGLLFSIFFTSMDSVYSIVSKSGFWSKIFFCDINKISNISLIFILSLNVIFSITFFVVKSFKKTPATITAFVLGANSLVCLGVRFAFFMCDKYNIFFDFESLNILPIMTIIVSSVFIVYDYIDFYRGTYRLLQSTMIPTDKVVKETIDIIAKRSKEVTDRLDGEKSEHKENLSAYRTNEGYFNNDALEIAADNMIAKIKK